MIRRYFLSLVLLGLAVAFPAAQAPQEAIDADVNTRIRKEGWDNSQILATMHMLTDVHGPRLTGSPNHENAAKWAVQRMERWGFKNGKLEPWDFARSGWLNEKAAGHILTPVKDNLVFEVLAWTPSTNGTVTGPAVHIVTPVGPMPERTTTTVLDGVATTNPATAAGGRGGGAPQPLGPTEEELKTYLASMASSVKGAIVFVGAHRKVPFQETPAAKRRDDAQAKAQYNPDPNAPAGGGRGRGGGGRGNAPSDPKRLSGQQVNAIVNDFLLANGAAVRVNDAEREHGQIRAFSYSGYDTTKTIPTVVLRNEDYGRIARILADGTPVTMEFTIVNRDYPAGKTSYNAIAEIPGTDKAAEVVMLGGHLDSWHSATGATDNAIGCAVMMEAARILQAIGVKPRRTIRVALWGGEEQGLLGSKAYVAQHFGTAETPKPEFATFNGYFNVDSGTGRIRGGSVFGPPEAAQILAQYFKPFEDFGIYGATASTGRNAGGTDSTSFSAAGLPGIGLGQDPIEYQSHTWHTNLDTYERIVEDDVKKSAIAIASALYHVAMRDQMLPRFPPDKMPPLPATGRGSGPGQ